jgi:hypothetical protein
MYLLAARPSTPEATRIVPLRLNASVSTNTAHAAGLDELQASRLTRRTRFLWHGCKPLAQRRADERSSSKAAAGGLAVGTPALGGNGHSGLALVDEGRLNVRRERRRIADYIVGAPSDVPVTARALPFVAL